MKDVAEKKPTIKVEEECGKNELILIFFYLLPLIMISIEHETINVVAHNTFRIAMKKKII